MVIHLTKPDQPEFPDPFPYPPLREMPRRTEPLLVPTVTMPAGDAYQRLLDRRTVMVSGELDHDSAARLCAELLALDSESDRDVRVIINSPGGPLTEIAAILDVYDVVHGRVHTTCIGTARGTAGAALCCATGTRRAAPNATISVRCQPPRPTAGSADELAREAAEYELLTARLRRTLAAATGRPTSEAGAELDHGELHGAAEARDLGLIDEVGSGAR